MVGMCAAERQQNNTYPKWKQVGNVCLVLLGFVGMGAAEALWRSLLTTPHARLGATAREHCLCAFLKAYNYHSVQSNMTSSTFHTPD